MIVFVDNCQSVPPVFTSGTVPYLALRIKFYWIQCIESRSESTNMVQAKGF